MQAQVTDDDAIQASILFNKGREHCRRTKCLPSPTMFERRWYELIVGVGLHQSQWAHNSEIDPFDGQRRIYTRHQLELR